MNMIGRKDSAVHTSRNGNGFKRISGIEFGEGWKEGVGRVQPVLEKLALLVAVVQGQLSLGSSVITPSTTLNHPLPLTSRSQYSNSRSSLEIPRV